MPECLTKKCSTLSNIYIRKNYQDKKNEAVVYAVAKATVNKHFRYLSEHGVQIVRCPGCYYRDSREKYISPLLYIVLRVFQLFSKSI